MQNSKNWLKRTLYIVLTTGLITISGLSAAAVECSGGGICKQTIVLTPGWNAIYLQVQPIDKTPEAFFTKANGDTINVSSMWTYLAHRATVDYIANPDPEKLLSEAGWLRYFPATAKEAFTTNLFSLSANRAYLIKLEGEQFEVVNIEGTPVIPKTKWQPNSFNFTGFHIDPANPPTFSQYFAASPAHSKLNIYSLKDNLWDKVVTPDVEVIDPDKAYWVYSEQGSKYNGMFDVTVPQVNRLEYGNVIESLGVTLKNHSLANNTLSVSLAGDASGVYYKNANTDGQPWVPLAINSYEVSANASHTLRLGVRRADFTPGGLEQVLDIRGSGSRWLLPVTADAPNIDNSLWVGSVTIEKVAQVQNYKHDCGDDDHQLCVENVGRIQDTCLADGTSPGLGEFRCTDNINVAARTCDVNGENPGTTIPGAGHACHEFSVPVEGDNTILTPVAQTFSFRVIMHNNGGEVALLKDVILMKNQATDNESGSYVLVTDEQRISEFTGVAIRDGELVGKRLSTAAYDFTGNTQAMAGSIGSQLTISLLIDKQSPTNPYRHLYHAQHGKGYDITRTMEFSFAGAETGSFLRAGYDVLEGTYRETTTGLHKRPIIATGTFRLQHAAAIGSLH